MFAAMCGDRRCLNTCLPPSALALSMSPYARLRTHTKVRRTFFLQPTRGDEGTGQKLVDQPGRTKSCLPILCVYGWVIVHYPQRSMGNKRGVPTTLLSCPNGSGAASSLSFYNVAEICRMTKYLASLCA